MSDELKKPAQLRIFSKIRDKKSGKTLRQSILHPLLIATSIISVITIIFFNIVFWIMLYSGVVHDLSSTARLIEQVEIASVNESTTPDRMLELYNDELERNAVSYRSNMVFLDQNKKITKSSVEFQNNEKEAIEKSIADIEAKDKKSNISHLKIDKDILILTTINTDDSQDNAIIYASMRSLWSTVKWGNRAVFVIVALSFLAFVIASHIIANNISRPIKELSEHMEVVGDGNFAPVTISESSKEMQNLTSSINETLTRLQAYHDAHTRSIQNLSHDLKTPLMSIGGYAEGIKYGVLSDTEEAADIIINESKRLTGVVEKILILSNLDALHQPINMDFLNINDFVENEAKNIDGYALKQNIKINYSFENEDTRVLADPQLLSTIVTNLLSNAIRYAKTTVEIKTFEKDDIIYLCVMDDGIGLSEDDKKYLFVRYYVGKTGHTGLGLSAAKSAAEYMGCAIDGNNRCELEKGNQCYNDSGAIFTVKFYRTKQ